MTLAAHNQHEQPTLDPPTTLLPQSSRRVNRHGCGHYASLPAVFFAALRALVAGYAAPGAMPTAQLRPHTRGSAVYGRIRHSLVRAFRPASLTLAALALSAVLHEANAQDPVAAVHEIIEFTEPDPATPVPAELIHAQNALNARRDSNAALAIGIAKDIVTLARQTYGDPHEHVARALTNLAIVQAEYANYEAAIQNYAAAIDVHERASGTIVSDDLINPLVGLGGAFMALGESGMAIAFFERAIHISHVNHGVENVDQIEIVDALSHALYESGNLEASSAMQDAILILRERDAKDRPEQYLEALEQRSDWYVRVGEYDKAIWSFRRLRSAIAERYGEEDPRLIEPLLALADASLKQATKNGVQSARRGARQQSWSTAENRLCGSGYTCAGGLLKESGRRIEDSPGVLGEGMGALNHAVRIARTHASEHPERLARTLVHQGDWLASLDRTRDAGRRYREAWEILDADPERRRLRSELFATPLLVARARIRPIYARRADEPRGTAAYPQKGHVEVEFDVDARGRPTRVTVVSANPPGLMDGHVARQVRKFRYRPAFSDGEPRQVTGVVYRHTFRYDETRLTDQERERSASTTYEADASSPVDASAQ